MKSTETAIQEQQQPASRFQSAEEAALALVMLLTLIERREMAEILREGR
ncbi:MAG: hypothetical protein AB2L14_25495 [Candidatus Xenobiia bacterium LiM19]